MLLLRFSLAGIIDACKTDRVPLCLSARSKLSNRSLPVTARKIAARTALAFCILQSSVFAADSSGKFNIYLSGKPLAHESYSIASADGKITIDGSGAADLGMLKINIEQFKVVTDDKYMPLEAIAKAQMGKANMSVKAKFSADMAQSEVDTGQGPNTKEDSIHGGDIVINANLPIFPWSLLMPRVKLDTAEPQQFYAYILGQTEAPLTVVSKGKDTVEFANKTATLHHLFGSLAAPSGSIEADFWIDDDRRIIKAIVPAQSVEVYQEGFERKAPPAPKPDAEGAKKMPNP